MDILQLLHGLLFDYTLRTVALGTALLGLVSGALGAFALLRRQSLVGDAISHAALPGVVLAFLVTGLKAPAVLMLGRGSCRAPPVYSAAGAHRRCTRGSSKTAPWASSWRCSSGLA